LSKVFGCGIGYPVRTNDGKTIGQNRASDGASTSLVQQKHKQDNPRADSFSLYMNIVGDILLKNLLPKDKKIVKSIAHKIFPMLSQGSHALDQLSGNKLSLMNSPFKIAKMNKNAGLS
jgi:hypothetical protein